MNDEKWQEMWDAAQTVQRHLYVDEIIPSSLTVDQWTVSVSVEWDQLGRAANSIFEDAGTLPIDTWTAGGLDFCAVRGRVDGVEIDVKTWRESSRPRRTWTVRDLLAGEKR